MHHIAKGAEAAAPSKNIAGCEPMFEVPQMLEEIRKRLAAVHFVPFSIRLADGREVSIQHPEIVWMPAPGVLHIWNQNDKASDRINPLLIVSVSGEESWTSQ